VQRDTRVKKTLPEGEMPSTVASISSADVAVRAPADGYSALLLSANTKIPKLRDVARRLMRAGDPLLDPEAFAASLPLGYRPGIVMVYEAHDVVGIVYMKERAVSGIPNGIMYYDGSLNSPVVGNPLRQHNLFRAAMEALLKSPRVRAVRLKLLPGSDEHQVVNQLVDSWSIEARYSPIRYDDYSVWKHHTLLPLAATYEQFLEGLGTSTRHNFRRYRRRFDASGHCFVERLSMDELRSATLDIAPKSKLTSGTEKMTFRRQCVNMVASVDRPLAVGLKHKNGEWLSVIGGWYRPGGAVVCVQSNNERDFGADSLCTVIRAYLIELLIGQGQGELVFWCGTGAPLSHYAALVPTIDVCLDVTKSPWRVARMLASTIGPLLPKRLAEAARWFA
jgi:hypothetical protein